MTTMIDTLVLVFTAPSQNTSPTNNTIIYFSLTAKPREHERTKYALGLVYI